MIRELISLFSSDLAIDFGTHNTIIYAKGRGIVVSELSIVAIDKNQEVIAAGRRVAETLRTYQDSVTIVRPLKAGAITNLDLAEKLIQYCMRVAHNGKKWVSPRVVIGVHPEMSQVERHAVESCAYRAGASEVYLMETAIAAAHGAGVPMYEPYGVMLVDIGGGTTDINIISMGTCIHSTSIRAAGIQMDQSIIEYVRLKYDMLIGQSQAEKIKIGLGSAYPLDDLRTMKVRGRHLLNGELRTIELNDDEIREALSRDVKEIVEAIRMALETSTPELAADMIERGIILTGGGALLNNLDRRLSIETGLPITVAEDSLSSVVLGLGKTLHDFELHKRLKSDNLLYSSQWDI